MSCLFISEFLIVNNLQKWHFDVFWEKIAKSICGPIAQLFRFLLTKRLFGVGVYSKSKLNVKNLFEFLIKKCLSPIFCNPGSQDWVPSFISDKTRPFYRCSMSSLYWVNFKYIILSLHEYIISDLFYVFF